MATTSGIGNYSTFIDKLQANGLKTTALYGNETNFEQYGNALSSKLKQEVLESFDNDQDYVLQSQLAVIFKSQNAITSGSFIDTCKSMGLNVSVSYEATSYISDYKAGNYSGSVTDGSVAVYTISDGKGGEIKIVDANGNGYLETEELFMNQILGDINAEINAGGASGGLEAEPTQDEFNKKVEEFLKIGFHEIYAEELANELFGSKNLTYTGNFVKITQNDFNETVEEYLEDGMSMIEATIEAKEELDVIGFVYTGTEEEENKKESNIIVTAAGVSYVEPEEETESKEVTEEPVSEKPVTEEIIEEEIKEEEEDDEN